jgi:uncharacterized protein (TIGR00290 family)
MKKLWMSWSTGKDSAYALWKLRNDPNYEIAGLFTTVNEDYERVAMHSTRESLLIRQAEMLDLPLEIVKIPANCTNEIYERKMQDLNRKAVAAGISALGFGDLYLEDIRQYRERLLAGSGLEPVFPLWKRATDTLARQMIGCGIKAVLTCVDPSKLSPSFAGRYFDIETIADFPKTVDPCGENGEFHTFVFASPSFAEQISISIGEKVERDGFFFSDVLLSE